MGSIPPEILFSGNLVTAVALALLWWRMSRIEERVTATEKDAKALDERVDKLNGRRLDRMEQEVDRHRFNIHDLRDDLAKHKYHAHKEGM